MQTALRRLGGSYALYTRSAEALLLALREMQAQLALPEDVLRQRDLRHPLHKLKGLAASVGLARLAEASRRSEALVKDAGAAVDWRTATGPMRRAIGDHLPTLDALHQVLLSEAAAAAARPAPALQKACLQALLGLRELLIGEDYDAMGMVADIQRDFAEVLGEALEPLLEAMAQLEFGVALQECQLLIKKMNP